MPATPSSQSPLVSLEKATVYLPGQQRQHETPILQALTLNIFPQKHTALIGNNGSGKSTLLRLLRGEIWISSGNIYWHTTEGKESSPLAGRAMTALVSPAQHERYLQQGWCIKGMELLRTAFHDTPLLYTPVSEEVDEHILGLARHMRILSLLDQEIPSLSQGQLRLLLLGRALLKRPPLLLLDEATEGLDTQSRTRFLDTLEEYTTWGTLIMASHRTNIIPDYLHHKIYLHKGSLVSEEAFASTHNATPEPLRHSHLNESGIPLPHTLQHPEESSPPLIDLRNVSVFINRKKVLHQINWKWEKGEHWLIRGKNGSGKSTLLRLLAGNEMVADGGSISRYLPRHGGHTSLLETIQHGIHLVSDLGQALYSYDLTAFELVCSGFDNTIGIYRSHSPEEREYAYEMLQKWHLTPLAEKSIRHLSTGQLRLLFLARAMMGYPDILLLDEPCSGLDHNTRNTYLSLLETIAESDVHLLLVSHHEHDYISAINHTAHMAEGRILGVD